MSSAPLDLARQPEARHDMVADGVEHGFPGGEVAVQGAQRDPGRGGDLRHRDVVRVVVIEPVREGVEDRVPDDSGLPFPETGP